MSTRKSDPHDEKSTGAQQRKQREQQNQREQTETAGTPASGKRPRGAAGQPRRVFEVDRSGTARTPDEDQGGQGGPDGRSEKKG
ncbi:hypothetical protein ACFVT5_35215 [Streptomyces sp. NPDC058001]|uniref:hypothetical protein n=1 Tax=Streptomyces sp. NPDC058001 TaxID=3346300 RepID=UPI0036E8D05F